MAFEKKIIKKMSLAVGDYGQVRYNFQGESAGDLSLEVGDVVKVTDNLDANWLQGEKVCDGDSPPSGVFPASFVEHLSLPTVRTGQKIFLVLQDFLAEQTGDLELNKGEIVIGMEAVDEAWWRGKNGPLKGIFPLSFVVELWRDDGLRSRSYSARAGSLKSRSGSFASSRTSSIGGFEGSDPGVTKVMEPTFAQALVDVRPQLDGELAFQLGDLIEITEIIDQDWFFGRCHQKEGLVSAVCVELLEVEDSGIAESLGDGGTTTSNLPHAPPLPQQAVENITREEEDGRLRNLSTASYTSENTKSHDAEIVPYARVLFPFQSAGHSELGLEEGQIVTLIRHLDSDWTEGEVDGRSGIFPTDFVEIVVDCSNLDSSVGDTSSSRASNTLAGVSSVGSRNVSVASAWGSSNLSENRDISSAGSVVCSNSVLVDAPSEEVYRKVLSHDQNRAGTSSVKKSENLRVDTTISGERCKSDSQNLRVTSGITAGINEVLEVSVGSELGLVLHSFLAQEAGDATVYEGDTVEVVRRVDGDWLEVKVDEGQRSGLVPSNHVEIIGHWGSPANSLKPSEGREGSTTTQQGSHKVSHSSFHDSDSSKADSNNKSSSTSPHNSDTGNLTSDWSSPSNRLSSDPSQTEKLPHTNSENNRRASSGDVPPSKPSRPPAPPCIRNKIFTAPPTIPTKPCLPQKPAVAPKPLLKPKPPPPPQVTGFPSSRAPMDRSHSLNLPASNLPVTKTPMDRSNSIQSSKPSLITAKPFSSLPRLKPHHVMSPTERRLSMSSLDSIIEDEMEKAKSRSSSQASSSSDHSNSTKQAIDQSLTSAVSNAQTPALISESNYDDGQTLQLTSDAQDSQETLSLLSKDGLNFDDSFTNATANSSKQAEPNSKSGVKTIKSKQKPLLHSSTMSQDQNNPNLVSDKTQRRKSASYAEHGNNAKSSINTTKPLQLANNNSAFVNQAFEMDIDEDKLVEVPGAPRSTITPPQRPRSMPVVPPPSALSNKVKAAAPPRPTGPRIAPAPSKVPLVPSRVAPVAQQPRIVPKRPAPKPPGLTNSSSTNNNNNNTNATCPTTNNNNNTNACIETPLTHTTAPPQSGQPLTKSMSRPARQAPRPTSLASPPLRAPPPRPAELISLSPEDTPPSDVSEETTKEMVRDIKAKLVENQADITICIYKCGKV